VDLALTANPVITCKTAQAVERYEKSHETDGAVFYAGRREWLGTTYSRAHGHTYYVFVSPGARPSGRQRRVRVRRTDFDAFLARSQAHGPTGTPKTPPANDPGVVYRGIEAPALQRKVGPFTSRKLALEWMEQEGPGSTPSDAADWAAVFPVLDGEVK
jgi:hypothetical protein